MDVLAKGLGVTRAELRELAGEGKLTANKVAQAMLKMSDSVWFSGVLHATLMVVLLGVFNTSLGTTIDNKKEAWVGGLIGGGAFGIGMLLVVLAELAHIEHVAFNQIQRREIVLQMRTHCRIFFNRGERDAGF